jgi:hypothetical protein
LPPLAHLVFLLQLFELFTEYFAIIAAHPGAADKTCFSTLDADNGAYTAQQEACAIKNGSTLF